MSNNLLKIDNNTNNTKVEIIKKGIVNSKMTFIEKVKTESIYNTSYGKIGMMVDTDSIDIKIEEDMICIIIKYDLFMDREYVSKCKIDITIKSL